MLQLEVLVLELVAVDGLASSAVSSGEVATLAHEVGDDTVEGGSLEAVSLLAGAQGAEVLTGLGDNVSSQLKLTISVQISPLPDMSQHIFSSRLQWRPLKPPPTHFEFQSHDKL